MLLASLGLVLLVIAPDLRRSIFLVFNTIDRLGMIAAQALTAAVFRRGIAPKGMPLFFEVALIFATGVQSAALGLCVGFFMKWKSRSARSQV
jgi:hypothetical protein